MHVEGRGGGLQQDEAVGAKRTDSSQIFHAQLELSVSTEAWHLPPYIHAIQADVASRSLLVVTAMTTAVAKLLPQVTCSGRHFVTMNLRSDGSWCHHRTTGNSSAPPSGPKTQPSHFQSAWDHSWYQAGIMVPSWYQSGFGQEIRNMIIILREN